MRAAPCLLFLLLIHPLLVRPARAETVNADNGLYHDTGNGPCTRRVTVGGEADCYYSLKRLISGTGITGMNAKGVFLSNTGELVRYLDASADGEWSLESLPALGVRVASPSHTLHVQGTTRSSSLGHFTLMDSRIQDSAIKSDTTLMYNSVRAIEVRDFSFKPAYALENGLTVGETVRAFTSQQVEGAMPAAVSTVPGQEVFGEPAGAYPQLEVDAPKLVSQERLFVELLGAFQRLADLHDALRMDHDALQTEVSALKAQVAARDAADLADRLDLRSLLSTEASQRQANATQLSQAVSNEVANRVADVAKLTRDLSYVSRVFATYDGSGFGL